KLAVYRISAVGFRHRAGQERLTRQWVQDFGWRPYFTGRFSVSILIQRRLVARFRLRAAGLGGRVEPHGASLLHGDGSVRDNTPPGLRATGAPGRNGVGISVTNARRVGSVRRGGLPDDHDGEPRLDPRADQPPAIGAEADGEVVVVPGGRVGVVH